MSTKTETFDNAFEKVTQTVMLHEGKIYDAFDDLGTGVPARGLAAWVDRKSPQFSGAAFGMALTIAMVVVAADRRTRANVEVERGAEAWARDPEWERRMQELYAQHGKPDPPTCWVKSPFQALVSYEEPVEGAQKRWHVSVAHANRIPTWDELVGAVHALRPGVQFCVGLPTRDQWMNYDERVLHVWEIHDRELTASWYQSARGDRPT